MPSVAADRARLLKLESHICDLEHTVATLKAEHSTVKTRLDAVKYPVLTLPNEIVAEILVHCLPPYPYQPPLVGPSSPIPLTHICSRWRDIALKTPLLWRAVYLAVPACVPSDLQNIWLSRSGHCPISVGVDDQLTRYKVGGDELIAAVLPYCARWEYVSLSIDMVNGLTLEGSMPLLRKLTVVAGIWEGCLDFSDAPLLRSVDLDVCAARRIVLPWTQLTSMRLHDILFQGCFHFLRMATNLVHCELSLSNMLDDEDDVREQPVTLPSLESLTLRHEDKKINDCLGYLILPKLSRLIVDTDVLLPDPIVSLTSFISNAGCQLEHLCIEGTLADDSYRTALPSIKNLVFAKMYGGEDALGIESEWK
ncbi:F-box domain-containing protein [Favolaschia claudopus]|uniref:F-box domain-containing protein n=1 Tax=Favolaschia claudopus TaxID=2862362 RepID=A0AAW0DGR0_9AGAR